MLFTMVTSNIMYAHIGTPKTDRPRRRRRRCRAQHPFARSRLRAVAVLLVLSLRSHRPGSQPASFLAFSLLYTSPRRSFPTACPLGGSGGVLFVPTYNSLYDVHTVSSVGQKVLHEKVLEM